MLYKNLTYITYIWNIWKNRVLTPNAIPKCKRETKYEHFENWHWCQYPLQITWLHIPTQKSQNPPPKKGQKMSNNFHLSIRTQCAKFFKLKRNIVVRRMKCLYLITNSILLFKWFFLSPKEGRKKFLEWGGGQLLLKSSKNPQNFLWRNLFVPRRWWCMLITNSILLPLLKENFKGKEWSLWEWAGGAASLSEN